MATMTAPARLNLLLPWLNGDLDENYYEGRNPEPVAVRTDYAAIRRVLATFVKSFDGSEGAAHVVAEPDDIVDAIDDEAIGDSCSGVELPARAGLRPYASRH